jgi:hypothetical protein
VFQVTKLPSTQGFLQSPLVAWLFFWSDIMKTTFLNDAEQVIIEIHPENETECVALRLFCQLNNDIDKTNISIYTNTEPS